MDVILRDRGEVVLQNESIGVYFRDEGTRQRTHLILDTYYTQ